MWKMWKTDGCGKSHLIRTFFHSVKKPLSYRGRDLSKSRVLTGAAAPDISGNKTHFILNILS